MPKNYQITQFDQPICLGGAVPLHDFAYPKDAQKSIAHPGKTVRLTRIHLEEDVAQSRSTSRASTGIDFNRAGTPLMEIVSEPEIDIAGGSLRVSHLAPADPHLRRRERCRHGKRPAALRLQCLACGRRAAGTRHEDRDQKHELDQRRAARARLRDRAADRRAAQRGEKLMQ